MGLIITGAMMISPLVYSPAEASTDLSKLNIEDGSYYYVHHYRRGDCVLCSNAYMLMRAAYESGSYLFEDITNNKLRRYACSPSTGHSVKHSYSFTYDEITYKVEHLALTGTLKAKKKILRNLLDCHPEGVVVWGTATSGPHGVLLTDYEGTQFNAADSARNYVMFNEGITSYEDTTMKSIKTLKHIWYLAEESGVSISHVENMEPGEIKVKKTSKGWKLSWDCEGDDTELKGFKIYRVSSSDRKKGKSYEYYKTVKKSSVYIEDKKNGKTYHYKIRGYIKTGSGKIVCTKSSFCKIKMTGSN